jgi:hypothetical protein
MENTPFSGTEAITLFSTTVSGGAHFYFSQAVAGEKRLRFLQRSADH